MRLVILFMILSVTVNSYAADKRSGPSLNETLTWLQNKINGTTTTVVYKVVLHETKTITERLTYTMTYNGCTINVSDGKDKVDFPFPLNAIKAFRVNIYPLQNCDEDTILMNGFLGDTSVVNAPIYGIYAYYGSDAALAGKVYMTDSKELAERIQKALSHASKLCGAVQEKEAF